MARKSKFSISSAPRSALAGYNVVFASAGNLGVTYKMDASTILGGG